LYVESGAGAKTICVPSTDAQRGRPVGALRARRSARTSDVTISMGRSCRWLLVRRWIDRSSAQSAGNEKDSCVIVDCARIVFRRTRRLIFCSACWMSTGSTLRNSTSFSRVSHFAMAALSDG
jgi:hypothetical protein